MIDYYNEKGFYRPQDLRRLLGSPNEGFEVSYEGMRKRFLGN